MILLNTTGNFGDTVLISGSGNQFFAIDEVRYGGVSGAASQFNVINNNLISTKVPSSESLTNSGERDKWIKYGKPNPLLVISNTRGVSGYASGGFGGPKNFTPIPAIKSFTPPTGISGSRVDVKGDGFFGLTGLSISHISGSPSGYSHIQGLSNVLTGEGGDTVFLDFNIVNNTGLYFNLPSGNFDGRITVYGSGVSGTSENRVQPQVNITGFHPPIGFSGQSMLISGELFLDELMDYSVGSFPDRTGGFYLNTGFVVSFQGMGTSGASGVFQKVSNTLLSGRVPGEARSGPVKIKKNLNTVSPGESGYYNNTGHYCIQIMAPDLRSVQGVNGSEINLGYSGILETGNFVSGVSLTGASISNWNTGTAFFVQPVVTGAFQQVSQNITGLLNSGSGILAHSTSSLPFADGNTTLGTNPIVFGGNNLYQSGSCTGLGEDPIIVFWPVIGPQIEECLAYFNAGSGYLSGCEQAFLMYYSGRYNNLDVNSSSLQPGLLNCFFTSQAMNSGAAGQTNHANAEAAAAMGDQAPPNFDPYSSSLGSASPKPSAGGEGPGEIKTFPPNTNNSNVPNTSKTEEFGRQTAEQHLPGGSWSYPLGQGPKHCKSVKETTALSNYSNSNDRYGKTISHKTAPNYFMQGVYWNTAIIFPEGKPISYANNDPETASTTEKTPIGYDRIFLGVPHSVGRPTLSPTFHCGAREENKTEGKIRTGPLEAVGTVMFGSPQAPAFLSVIPNIAAGTIPGINTSRGGVPKGNPTDSQIFRAGQTVPISSLNGPFGSNLLASSHEVNYIPEDGESIPLLVGTSPLSSTVGNSSSAGQHSTQGGLNNGDRIKTSLGATVDPTSLGSMSNSTTPTFTAGTIQGLTPVTRRTTQNTNNTRQQFPGTRGECGNPNGCPPWAEELGICSSSSPYSPFPRVATTASEGITISPPTGATGFGLTLISNPEIEECYITNCFGHAFYTGATGYSYYDTVSLSNLVINKNTQTPIHTTEGDERTNTYYGQSGASGDFYVTSSGYGRFQGGYLQTESSTELDLSREPNWTVQFWMRIDQDITGVENQPYKNMDVALFGLSGEPSSYGNRFFNIGYTKESGVSGVLNTVKPYVDNSGVQSSSNYYTGWFADTGWHHVAFIKDQTGYATYYDGFRVGEAISTGTYNQYIPSGEVKFYFGGVASGTFEPFNTGYNQQFSTDSQTDLLLHFNNDLVDSGNYNQTISSGNYPVFSSDAKFGSHSINLTGQEFIHTTGTNFNYGTGDFTIECWIKPSGATKGDGIMGNAIQSLWMLGKETGKFETGNGLGLFLNHNNNSLRLAFDSDNSHLQVDLIPPHGPVQFRSGEWNHVSITRENNIFYGFVNGNPAGGFGGSDFANHQYTKNYFTGNPTFNSPDQKLFVGGAVSGEVSDFVVDTGELFNTQPYKIQRSEEIEHVTLDLPLGGGFPTRGQQQARFREIGRGGNVVNTGEGYKYTVKQGGDIELIADVTSRWGGAYLDNWMGGVSYAGVRFEHNGTGLNSDGSVSEVSSIENTVKWKLGGIQVTNGNRYSYVYGGDDDQANFNDRNESNQAYSSSLGMRGCYLNKQVVQVIKNTNPGDVITFKANRYFNEGGPGSQNGLFGQGQQSIEDLWKHYSRTDIRIAGPDMMHVNGLTVRESKIANYIGQVDEFRISSGIARYSSTPTTGTYESGYLNTDLGLRVFVDELNIKKSSQFVNDNGKYFVPTGAYVTGYNFETVLDSGNLIENGTTGDNLTAGTELRTFFISDNTDVQVTFSENGNSKFGNYSMYFPTGNLKTGENNFLYRSGVDINTGDFTAEMWIKPSGNAFINSPVISGFTGIHEGAEVSGELGRQTLLAFGDHASGFNFFLSGWDSGNYLGLNISNTQDVTGFNPLQQSGDQGYSRHFIFNQYGSNREVNSGEWNHVAFVRHNRSFYAYLNGFFAGRVNYTGELFDNQSEFDPRQYYDGVDISGDSNYITGITHDLNVSGRMVVGGGSSDSLNFQGNLDSFKFSKTARYTGLYISPKPYIICDDDNEFVCHFDRVSGAYNFVDDHCCRTGVQETGIWGETIGIFGSGFFDVTGVLFGEGRTPAEEWFVSERNYLSAVIPDNSIGGPTVIVGSGYEEVTGCPMELGPPDISILGFSPTSGYADDVITVSGKSLNKIDKLNIYDENGQAIFLDFTGTNTTGLVFSIPFASYNLLPANTDILVSGFTGSASPSGYIRTGSLRILTTGIKTITPESGVFGETVSLSGNYFESGVDIPMFAAYQTGDLYASDFVQQNYVPALDIEYIGNTGIKAKVPKELYYGKMIISGSGNGLTTESTGYFTPIPTITGIEITKLKVGSAFRITGVNACNIAPLIGFTGDSVQPYTVGDGVVGFVASSGNIDGYTTGAIPPSGFGINNPTNYEDTYYFGNIFIDKSQLSGNYPASSKTGFVVITGTISNNIIGTGNPFLISDRDYAGTYGGGDEGVSVSFYDSGIKGLETGTFFYAKNNISNVTGDQIVISGRCPILSGLRPLKGDESTQLLISGLNLLNLTGIQFQTTDQLSECSISTGEFIRKITYATGTNPLKEELTKDAVATGWHIRTSYQGTGEFIDKSDWINYVVLTPCPELKNFGTVNINALYDSGICTTGDIS